MMIDSSDYNNDVIHSKGAGVIFSINGACKLGANRCGTLCADSVKSPLLKLIQSSSKLLRRQLLASALAQRFS